MKKRIISFVLVAAFVFSITASAVYAADEIQVTIDGRRVVFGGQQPVIVDGRTLVPVRGVFEQLGFEVSWNGAARQAMLSDGSNTLILTIGSPNFMINGRQSAHVLEVPAQIIGGSTMLPLRAVLESVGYQLDWDAATRTVSISQRIAGERSRDQHLFWALPTLPLSLDPAFAMDTASAQVMELVHQRLFAFDDNMEIVGQLAADWEFIDNQNLRVQIRENVKFHDGTILTADDVAWSLERAGSSPFAAPMAHVIDSVTVEDAHTVVIHLEEPFAPVLALLANRTGSVLSRAAVERVGEDFHQFEPIGLGSFKVIDYIHGERIAMIRFDDFWGEAPILESINVVAVHDAIIRADMLLFGEVDIAYGVLADDLRYVPNVNVLSTFSLGSNYIGFNTQKPPFDDVRVRHAIDYAIDMEQIIEAVFGETARALNGPLADAVWGSISTELPQRSYNPERARELLKEAGIWEGFQITIWTNYAPQRIDIAQIVQFFLWDVGLDSVIEILDWGTYLDLTAAGEHDMFILGWAPAAGDADFHLFPLYHSSSWGALGNRTFYRNLEVDRLLEEARAEIDTQRRLALYAEAQRLIFEDAPKIWTNQGELFVGARDNIRGLRLSPNGLHSIAEIYFVN